MLNILSKSLARKIFYNRDYQFWLLQIIGWSGHSLVSFVSLDLWYNEPNIQIISHNILQSLLGILLTWPLRNFYTRFWNVPTWQRFVQTVVAILLVSLVWSSVRIEAFIIITGEKGLWDEFGGWYFSSIFVLAAWSSLYFGLKYYMLFQEEHSNLLMLEVEREEESRKRYQAELAAQTAQLKMLRYQLNPHFLFNTLNSIMSLVATQDNDRANAMLVKLSQFMRYSLDKNHEYLVDLQDEVDAIGLYLAIEKVRFEERLNVIVDIDSSILRAQIPGLLLQPIVENAIKYGIAPAELGGDIVIAARADNTRLLLRVEDRPKRGVDNHAVDVKQGLGVGLNNTEQRLDTIFSGDYKFNINIDQNGAGSVEIDMPLVFGVKE